MALIASGVSWWGLVFVLLYRNLGTSKLISNRCADYRLQDHGLHWALFRWHGEDYGLRGGGGWSGL